MEIQLVEDRYNPLLRRREIKFGLAYPIVPKRLEVRKGLASKLEVDVDRTFIVRMGSKTGMHLVEGEAEVYDSVEDAKAIVPKHIWLRNNPPKEAEE